MVFCSGVESLQYLDLKAPRSALKIITIDLQLPCVANDIVYGRIAMHLEGILPGKLTATKISDSPGRGEYIGHRWSDR